MNLGFDRTVVLASADAALRQRLRSSLSGMRWKVREARGGAEAIAQLEEGAPEALLLDHWLPDLDVMELAEQIGVLYPEMDLLQIDDDPAASPKRSPHRHELLHALREARGLSYRDSTPPSAIPCMDGDRFLAGGSSPAEAPASNPIPSSRQSAVSSLKARKRPRSSSTTAGSIHSDRTSVSIQSGIQSGRSFGINASVAIEGLIGQCPNMLDLARSIRLVAPRTTTVLIEGETGTGKEVVSRALHRLSPRSAKPFVVLNCAAIPETLLEAELFGHSRGAFTGAVQSRTGRIETAHGGTLLLDEIGEMPLGLQAKMLRFLEGGELQRVGENEMIRVDVRVIAATHQPLERLAMEGGFRLDLYHRLAVFPLDIPPLRERLADITALSDHFLTLLGKTSPRKRLSAAALEVLHHHDWPGNVRELAHVLEHASILAEDSPLIRAEHIHLRRASRD